MKKSMINSLSVIGLGKLGLPLASVFAKKGFKTIAVDVNKEVINSINNGINPIVEPQLEEYISELGGNMLLGSLNHSDAIEKSNISYIITATPSKPDGSFSNNYIESSLKSLSIALKKNNKEYHLFVISSTVAPRSIEKSFIPLVEKYSNRKLNEGFGIAYCPDFVALGNVINGFLNPEFVMIGESDKIAGDIVEKIHHSITDNEPYIGRMSLISAEIAKVALNAYITMKISFANNLANICEKLPGSNVDDITNTIGRDKRISHHYFKGGMSYGGTCFPRDTWAFINISQNVGISADLIHAVEQINDYQDDRLFSIVKEQLNKHKLDSISILGMSFKLNTPVITESVGTKLVNTIIENQLDIKIKVYDRLALDVAKAMYDDQIEYASTIDNCINGTRLIVLTNPEREFVDYFHSEKGNNINAIIIDCWRILNKTKLNNNDNYIAWGIGE